MKLRSPSRPCHGCYKKRCQISHGISMSSCFLPWNFQPSCCPPLNCNRKVFIFSKCSPRSSSLFRVKNAFQQTSVRWQRIGLNLHVKQRKDEKLKWIDEKNIPSTCECSILRFETITIYSHNTKNFHVISIYFLRAQNSISQFQRLKLQKLNQLLPSYSSCKGFALPRSDRQSASLSIILPGETMRKG